MKQVYEAAKDAVRLQQIIFTPPSPTTIRLRIKSQLKYAALIQPSKKL